MRASNEQHEEAAESRRGLARLQPALPLAALGSGLHALREIASRTILRRDRETRDVATSSEPGSRVRRKVSPVLVSFIALVLIPAATATVYLAFIASDQFTAETRFAVRAADDRSGDGLKLGLDSATSSAAMPAMGASTASLAQQDAEIVSSYIRSRAIIDDLKGVIDIGAIFRRPEADFWARLRDDSSAERIRDYWLRMVSSYVENTSGIVTVKVRAFRRDDALDLAKAVLDASERLVNSISLRARADAMRRAEEEVRRADGSMRLALADLADFRDAEGIIDPVKEADLTTKILLGLMQDKIKIEMELFVTRRLTSAEAPGVASLRARLESVEGQIARTRGELAGTDPGTHNLAAALVRFEELEVKRQFAEAMYTFARDGLDRARVAAQRQTVYVTVFVPPALPQEMSYPLRFTFSALIAIGLTVVWAIGAMISASIMDHRI